MSKKRYVFVGTGGRAVSFLEPMVTTYRDHNELVALCDLSPTRMAYYNERLAAWGAPQVPTWPAEKFDELLRETRPDVVFVCSKDSTHDDYIIRSLRAGCDVVTEKPMTIDDARCRRILDTVQETGKRLRVAFNYRWGAYRTKVKELISSGVIGNIKSVNLEYLLDTSHGADYFRRWHAHLDESGSLLVHKSTHHFDLVNWWIDAIPQQVFAYGDLAFYGRENALSRGDAALAAYDRYTGTPSENDPFRLDLTSTETFRRLYLEAEKDTGYIRDRNVFRDDISIHDSLSLNVRYRSGQVLTYSLTCFSPREGMRVAFNGDRGRIEYYEFTGSHLNRGVSSVDFKKENRTGADEPTGEWIRVYPHFKPSYDVPVPPVSGPHGGADVVLNEQIFSANPPPDTWNCTAGHEQGAASILVGIAGVKSIATNAPVNILDLVKLRPDARRLKELV